MTDVCPEDPSNPAWDPLREQDWASLGVVVDAMDPEDTMAHWESLTSTGAVASHAANSAELGLDDEEISLDRIGKRKVCIEFSPVAVDSMVECLEHNSSWPFGSSSSSDVSAHGRADADVKEEEDDDDGLLGRRHSEDGMMMDGGLEDADDAEIVLPPFAPMGAEKPGAGPKSEAGSGLGRGAAARGKLSLAIPGGKSEQQRGESEDASKDGVGAGDGEKTLFPVHLFVTAIADGKIINDTSPKMYAVLEQVRRKVSKEQNTVVQVCNEGAVDLKMRVFVANSVEAKAVGDYIAAHPTQIPAPFVVLSKQLLMAVSYDAAALNPSHASVADRLRKQIKTHAVKVLREAIGDKSCNLCTAMLRGFSGPMAPAKIIEPLVALRTQAVPRYPGKRYIVLPAKNKTAREEGRAPSSSGASSNASTPRAPPRSSYSSSSAVSSAASTPAARPPFWPPSVQIPMTPRSPDTSAPSTPGAAQDELEAVWEGRLSAHFPVNLFVTAIADGDMARDTPPKVQERLSQIVRKVPKEQNTSVEVAEGQTIDLKMRVFVVNSEDAKAVGEYINAHLEQLPAPFVVLARHLPMAVLYDPATLDLTDASVADRLRKQAKTRAVKVLREAIGNKQIGITQHMLRGHCGAMQPAERLAEFLAARTQPLDGDPKNKCVVFAARNKGCSVPCSPRKRPADSPPPLHEPDAASPLSDTPASPIPPLSPVSKANAAMRALGGANRRGGASSASYLHRNMLDKALHKKARGLDPLRPVVPGAAH